MNEQLQNALTQLLNKAVKATEAGAEFLSQEIPDVVMQLLIWHGVYNFILFIIGVVVLITIFCIDHNVGKRLYNLCEREGEFDSFWFLYVGMGSVGRVFFYGIPLDLLINVQWLQIWIAPKVWLIEYASKLVK